MELSHHNANSFTAIQLLFNFMLLLLIIISSYLQPAMSKPHNNYTDLQSLLAFKAAVTDPNGLLDTNWTTNNTSSFCTWIGVYCSSRRQRVVGLQLQNVSLHGTISPHLGNLSFLSTLYLENNHLTGPFPDTLGQLPRLAELELLSNYLSGQIPSTIFNMSSLTTFSVDGNNLTGSLPSNINLPRLQFLSLSNNQLTGLISSALGLCSNLQILSLSYNQFSGRIPPELGNITGLNFLAIGADQLISGTIPTSIGNLTNLRLLDLSNTSLEGVIPEELGNLLSLQTLNLGYNNLTGKIPTSLLNCTKLNFIQLIQNDLTGPIPASIGEAWQQLTSFLVGGNQLSGGLDFITSLTNCKDLYDIFSWENPIEGVLPDTIGNLSTTLGYFQINGGRIRGKIPIGFGNLSNLLILDLGANQLTGELPSDLSRLEKLQQISLGENEISGIIPFQLGRMTGLNKLYIEENALSGSIPDSLSNISMLQQLSLGGNRLSSSIPDILWSLQSLLYINFSLNALQGSLPMQVGNLKVLDTLDLSNNRLSGNISTALGELQMLAYLDLSCNSFHNEIPQSLGGLINIQYLNLSHNVLSGFIPKSLASLHYLTSLDLSFNKLEGHIPEGRVFSNASIPSLEGNADLCGAPQLHFAACSSMASPSHSKNKVYLLRYILPSIAIVVVLVFCLYLFLRCRPRSIKGKTPSENAYLSKLRMISYQEVVHATNNFNVANLLGKGSFSSVFKGNLNDGLIVAVKVLNLETRGALKSFGTESYALSMLRHRNLVKIISVCSNMEFKALIFQFMPNGNMDQWLHSHNYLNLLQRINIMVDVSLAMEYLHHDHPEVIVHCDLKPSNVLFDENMVAHVGDFGIAKLLLGDGKSMMSASTSGTIGYIAPEYGSTGKISRKGDIYSFGILLLETFTRRRPSDAMFDGGLSLRQWVSDAYPDAMLKIVDGNILREDVITKRLPEDHTIIHQCLSSVIELGLICSSHLPKERISMRDVVPKLQKIKREYLSMLPNA